MFHPKTAALVFPLMMGIAGTCLAAPLSATPAQQPLQLAQAQATTTVDPATGVTQTTTTDPSTGTTRTTTMNPATGTTQVTTTEIIAPSAPPAPEAETIPPPPSSVVYWQPGRWNWTGASWAWIPGQYVQRPQPQAVWQPGHWQQAANGAGWQWIDGHWE
jgi:hypothetical protein